MPARARVFSFLIVLVAISSACAGRINDTVWLPFTTWSLSTAVGSWIQGSIWQFAFIESIHLIGLAWLGGAVLLVDFRLLGFALRGVSLAKLSRDVQPWLVGGLAVTMISGLLLYLSEATKFYSPAFIDSAEFPFIYKMLFLILAIIFTFTVRRKVLAADDTAVSPLWRKLVGMTSILLWSVVGIGGRAIGFW